MKQFNLCEYLKNPSKKIVTRDGRVVTKFLCTDAKGDYPIVALVESHDGTVENSFSYTTNGKIYSDNMESCSDLFFDVPKHREGWVNIYRNKTNGESYCGKIYESEDDAKAQKDILTTIKIEWEE